MYMRQVHWLKMDQININRFDKNGKRRNSAEMQWLWISDTCVRNRRAWAMDYRDVIAQKDRERTIREISAMAAEDIPSIEERLPILCQDMMLYD